MPLKRLHVLANSRKNQEHCIAGRELIIDQDGALNFGGWIRPVSRHGEGELSWNECRFPSGKTPEILDVVEIDFDEHAGSLAQPENWFIRPHAQWKEVNIDADDLPNLRLDRPHNLWLEPGPRCDRIAPENLRSLNCGASLYLIQVSDFRIRMSWRKWEDEKLKQRCRAHFRYNGIDYDFSLTDPIAREKYCGRFPGPDERPRVQRLKSGNDCILCVSLTPEFNGYHYKIAATVMELPDVR